MIGWFVHGWGLGPSIWDELIARLPQIEPRLADLGYFAEADDAPPDAPAIWITHSFGTMHALAQPARQCRALVAINGFDRFTGDGGVPVRVLDRMLARFEGEPLQVVGDFRARCGSMAAVDHCHSAPLRRDLVILRDGDCQEHAKRLHKPILALHGGMDPILPEQLRQESFASDFRDVHPDAGHLLPLEQPDWCAARIGEFLRDMGL